MNSFKKAERQVLLRIQRIVNIFNRLQELYYLDHDNKLLDDIEKIIHNHEWNDVIRSIEQNMVRRHYKETGLIHAVKYVKQTSMCHLKLAKQIAEYICSDLILEKENEKKEIRK
jgi:hypothetical protein